MTVNIFKKKFHSNTYQDKAITSITKETYLINQDNQDFSIFSKENDDRRLAYEYWSSVDKCYLICKGNNQCVAWMLKPDNGDRKQIFVKLHKFLKRTT